MSDAPLMVGVSGLRGITGESLTEEVVARYVGAFVTGLPEGSTIVMGRDGRADGRELLDAAVDAARERGVHVIDVDVAMTPTMGHCVDHRGLAGAVVLTASHNPQQWNGVKCIVGAEGGACAPPPRMAEAIIERFHEGTPTRSTGEVTRDDQATPDHVDAVIDAIEETFDLDASTIGAGLHVAVDSVNASGVEGARLLLELLGCDEILHLGAGDSGIFPHPPEPTLDNLTDLCQSVRESDAMLGFAQDPDADRLAIVDGSGAYIGEEYTLVLGAMAMLEASGTGRICTNLSTSRMIDDLRGATVVRTAVGEANVVEAMKREGALIGGEGNGGVIWPRITCIRDSLSAMALTLALMHRTDSTLADLVSRVPRYAIRKRKTPLRSRAEAVPAVETLKSHYASASLDLQDGIRIDWPDRWLHVRASNTEPIMRLIAEAPDEEAADALLDEAAGVIG